METEQEKTRRLVYEIARVVGAAICTLNPQVSRGQTQADIVKRAFSMIDCILMSADATRMLQELIPVPPDPPAPESPSIVTSP